MTIIQNAFKSITRSKARNVFIGFIIICVTAASVIALTIEKSAMEIIELQKSQFSIQGSIVLDRNLLRTSFSGSNESMREMMASVPTLTENELIQYGNSEHVRELTYSLTIEVNSSGVVPVGADEEVVTKEGSAGNQRGQFTLVGVTDPATYDSFLSGEYRMLEGDARSLGNEPNNILINEELAIMNTLAVGDAIQLENPLDPLLLMDFVISGIYSDESEANAASMSWFSRSANQMIGNYERVLSAYASSMEDSTTAMTGTYAHTFFLENFEAIEAFESDLFSNGLNPYYMVRTNGSELNKVMQPLENLNNFTALFFVLVLVVGGAILLVINMINIRERKYEIGVLRAIGMKKGKVAAQFLTELTIVTLLAMVIGIGLGQSLSEPIGNHLLKNEIEQAELEQKTMNTNLGSGFEAGGGTGGRNAVTFAPNESLEYIDALDTRLDNVVILQMVLISLSIVLIGSLISLVTISRYEPLKILSTRS